MSVVPPSTAAASALQAQVDLELLRIAYDRLPLSLLLTAAVTCVFIGLMAFVFPAPSIALWGGAIVASVVARLGLWRAYRHRPAALETMARWRRWFLLGSAATGAAWASGPVLIVTQGAVEAVSLLVVTLLSVCAVAMNTQSAQRGAMQAFITAALLPFALAVALRGGMVDLILMLALLAGLTSLIAVGRGSSRALRELIEAQITQAATADEGRAARLRAESASKAKTRFLANMSHELRTPLNAVIGAAQLLRAERANPQQQRRLVDGIQRSGGNLLGLIDNILDLSRIEAGELGLRGADFDLVECIDSSLASAALAAQAKGLRLVSVFSPALPAWRHGDVDRVRQVMMNLLGNAVKFTDRGEVVVRVEPGGSAQAVCISVTDTGIGIDARALAHIFEPFRQAEEGSDRRYGGSGLGLAIVRQLIEAMGGRVSVSSRLGEGSRFELELPLPQAPAGAGEPAGLGFSVLIHEPHEPSAEALQSHLLRLGCRVLRCSDEAHARSQLADMSRHEQPWLLWSAGAPGADELLDAVAERIEPTQVIEITDHRDDDADAAGDRLPWPRPLSRPVTRAALLSRLLCEPDTQSGALKPSVRAAGSHEHEAMTHVLVVEDDEFNRSIVCRLLQHGGCRVSAAGGGNQALRVMRESKRVDLVLMDWQMPDMDGLEVTRRLRAGEAGPAGRSVPIVALTANAFSEDREACLRAGMNDYLTKPVQAHGLMATIERWTRGAAARAATKAADPPARPPGATTVFDPAVLAALPMVADGSDPGYARELLRMFLDGGAGAVADIERAAAAQQAEVLLRLVHTLKSASASVGALEIAERAAALESQLRRGAAPAADFARPLRESLRRLRRATGLPSQAPAAVLDEGT